MLEREITDVGFVQRWSIVRTLMPQSVAEHSWFVAMYSNDFCHIFGLEDHIQLAVLKYAIWHDVDEQFTGDLPGPNKRALFDAMGSDAESHWKYKVVKWMDAVFPRWYMRAGGDASQHKENKSSAIVKSVVKAADWLEASVRMATEHQMGNGNVRRHIEPNANGCKEHLWELYRLLGGRYTLGDILSAGYAVGDGSLEAKLLEALRAVDELVGAAACGLSRGPYITGEDDSRTYHEPCVDPAR